MRDIRFRSDAPLRDVRTPDGGAVRDGIATARELSATVARLLPVTSKA